MFLLSVNLGSDDLLPFHGYRQPLLGSFGFERGTPEFYSTIEHFFQSEKFRGVDESLRQYVIGLPSAAEARKAGLRYEKLKPRAGWFAIQNQVMRAGIWMKLREHAHYARALLTADSFSRAYRFNDSYWGNLRQGVSAGAYASLLAGLQQQLRSGPMRVAIVGSRSFTNAELHKKKLDAFFARALPMEILLGCNKGCDDLTERWAIANYVPVVHFPLVGGRSASERDRRNTAMLSEATHLVAFWQDKTSEVAEIVALAKSRNLPSRIVHLDSVGAIVRTIPSPSLRPTSRGSNART